MTTVAKSMNDNNGLRPRENGNSGPGTCYLHSKRHSIYTNLQRGQAVVNLAELRARDPGQSTMMKGMVSENDDENYRGNTGGRGGLTWQAHCEFVVSF